MKRVVADSTSSRMSITPKNYIEDCKEAKDSVDSITAKLSNELKQLISDISEYEKNIPTYGKAEYLYDNYDVDNPEEYDWFNSASDDDVEKCYDTWDGYVDAIDEYKRITRIVEDISDDMYDIVHKLEEI